MANETDNPAEFQIVVSGEGLDLNRTVDRDTALAIMQVALGGGAPAQPDSAPSPRRRKSSRRTTAADGDDGGARPKRRKGGPGYVRDLSLKPSGKTSLEDFVAGRALKTHGEKQIVILSWLVSEGGLPTGITLDHINTCYKHLGWKRPKDFENSLQSTASRQGWLDTSDMSDIKLTVQGEDAADDLPAATAA